MSGDELNRLERRAYALAHPLTLAIGVGGFIAALASLILLTIGQDAIGCGTVWGSSSLTVLAPSWLEFAWAALYLLGGACLSYGILRLSLRAEVAGCIAIAGVELVNVYAVTVVRGPIAGLISGVGLEVAIGLLVRAWLLLHSHRRREVVL